MFIASRATNIKQETILQQKSLEYCHTIVVIRQIKKGLGGMEDKNGPNWRVAAQIRGSCFTEKK